MPFSASGHQADRSNVRINLISIGTSKGIRLPKTVLEQCRVQEAFDLQVGDDVIVLRPVNEPRRDWDKAFREMAENEEDALFNQETSTAYDHDEWKW
jgi:antitoxin MazE